MNRLCIISLVLFFQAQLSFAQTISAYEYVRVPESFNFLKESNQHELNALTAFLFKKYGYEALYKEPAPTGVSGCDILQASVENDSGLFMTRLRVVLKNCSDEIVFTSEEGKSREKDYKMAYHAALRDAFESLEGVQLIKSHSGNLVDQVTVTKQTEKIGREPSKKQAVQDNDIPTAVKSYTNGTTTYRLEKNSSGYELYREGEGEKFATLLKSNTGDHFIYTSESIQGTAIFDEDHNLIVEYVDRNSGQLLNLEYNIKH